MNLAFDRKVVGPRDPGAIERGRWSRVGMPCDALAVMRYVTYFVLAAAVTVTCSVAFRAAAPIPVMLLDGESGGPYHKWQRRRRC